MSNIVDNLVYEEKVNRDWQLNDNSRSREINYLIKHSKKSKVKCKYTIVTYDQKETIKQNGITINVIPLKDLLLMY